MACALKILWHQWKSWGGRRARAQREPARACVRQEKGPRRSREGHSRSLSTHDEVMLPEPFATGDGLNRAALMERCCVSWAVSGVWDERRATEGWEGLGAREEEEWCGEGSPSAWQLGG